MSRDIPLPPFTGDSPIYSLVAGIFDEFAADLDRFASEHAQVATRLRRNAEMLRAAEVEGEIVPRSLKVVPDEVIPL